MKENTEKEVQEITHEPSNVTWSRG